jgi:hypothetical protein
MAVTFVNYYHHIFAFLVGITLTNAVLPVKIDRNETLVLKSNMIYCVVTPKIALKLRNL